MMDFMITDFEPVDDPAGTAVLLCDLRGKNHEGVVLLYHKPSEVVIELTFTFIGVSVSGDAQWGECGYHRDVEVGHAPSCAPYVGLEKYNIKPGEMKDRPRVELDMKILRKVFAYLHKQRQPYEEAMEELEAEQTAEKAL